MEEAHIYIYGDIGCWQDKNSADWGEVTLTSVRDQYEAQKQAESITLHIHSPGGYVAEGFAIHDYIRSLGKPVTTIIEGMCYSIATVIALAGDTRKMTSNADFMIHNPWGGMMGDSSELQKYADELKGEEDRIADFYAKKTKISKDKALEMMKEETFMPAEEALKHGFITEIAVVMKAVAKLNINTNKNEMAEAMTKEEAQGMFAKLEEKIGNFFKNTRPQNKVVQDASGAEIDFYELEEDATPAVGDKARINDADATGEHVMPNGETYIFEDGTLTEIRAEETEEEIEELKEEIEELKEELQQAKAKNQKQEDGLKDIQKEIKALKSSIGSGFKHETEKKNYQEPKQKVRTI